MYTLVGIIIIALIFIGLGALYSAFKSKISFFVNGLDAGFSIHDLVLLWNTAQICDLEQPTSLFYSLNSLTKCMTQIQNETKASADNNNPRNQLLLSKLFDYRTKIQNESDDKKGLSSTKSLEKGQKLRIILPGKGVFATELVNNGNMMVINVPKQKNIISIAGEDWVGKVISVYLWRKGDARYVFDTTVEQQGIFLGKSALFLKHSYNLVRTQKRKSIRSACQIYGQLFIMKNGAEPTDSIETQNGYKCLIEDISESGALIRIGGKGIENIKIKLQYSIQNKLILMSGVIRSVEYNEEQNQSLLHFECTKIDPIMKNEILSYVYNMLPESEKEILEALAQTDDDIDSEAENNSVDSENGSGDAPSTNEEVKKQISEQNAEANNSDEADTNIVIPTLESTSSSEDELNIF